MKITTVTIWQKDDVDPCTVSFDDRDKAEQYKERMEKIFKDGGDPYYRVTIDEGELNNGSNYMHAFASEMGIDIPDEPEDLPEDEKELTVTYAVEGRYFTTVRLPRGTRIPTKNSSREEQEGFIDAVKGASIIDYYDADFGELSDIDGRAIIIEDSEGDIIWEDGLTTLVK